MFAAGIFLFFLICYGYSCVYTIFIECIALSVFLNSTVFVHDSCFRIKIISLSVQFEPASLHLSIGAKIIGMAFIVSAPCIEYLFDHNAVTAKIIYIIPAVHVPHMSHHVSVFGLKIIIVLSNLFHAF